MNYINNAKDGKFHYSYKTNIRFVPVPKQVSVGDTVTFQISYDIGDSEVRVELVEGGVRSARESERE